MEKILTKEMTIKEAIIKSLDDIKDLATPAEIYDHIVKNDYYIFGAKKPLEVVNNDLRILRINGDSRIKRIKLPGKTYKYYLSKHEQILNLEQLDADLNNQISKPTKKDFSERDLHKLLSSYLKSVGIYSKTIFHEQSYSSRDNNQKWIHPDIIGVEFLKLKSKINQVFLKSINRLDAFKVSSYELKKEITTDAELKKSFFQAVSNSSWANFGYLVAFEISSNLQEEMERLNQSFGIGIIELRSNPFESKVLFQPKYKELDFKTIDKLCSINPEFEKFIEQIEKLMDAPDRYYKASEKEFDDFCDPYFTNDSEVEDYRKEKNIPVD
jgi:uncharacterized protein